VGGEERSLRELAALFLVEYPKWMAEMRAALAEGSPPRLRLAAHSLKGAVSILAAPAAATGSWTARKRPGAPWSKNWDGCARA
jgi:hypothetical protein